MKNKINVVFIFYILTGLNLLNAQSDINTYLSKSKIDTTLNRHSYVYAGEWDYRNEMQTTYLVRKGKVVWSYGIPIKDANGVLQELGLYFVKV